MESIVDDIITGRCCELCGQFFMQSSTEDLPPCVYEHGHPAVCHDCWNSLSADDQRNHLRAKVEIFG